MIIKLENLFNNNGEVVDIDTELDFTAYEAGAVKPFISPVKVKGRISNNTGVVSIKAVARFDYSAPCDRCAVQVDKKTVVPVEHFLASSLNNEDNDDYILVEDMHLDLDELVYSDVFLSLPSKFLCSDDCKGLCAGCGKNLNEGSCECKKSVDPRWDVLNSLFTDDGE